MSRVVHACTEGGCTPCGSPQDYGQDVHAYPSASPVSASRTARGRRPAVHRLSLLNYTDIDHKSLSCPWERRQGQLVSNADDNWAGPDSARVGRGLAGGDE